MKKIVLMLLAVSILTCLLAISISASDFVSSFGGEVVTFGSAPEWANVEDADSTAVIKKADGSYVRVPVSYVFKANGNNQFALRSC